MPAAKGKYSVIRPFDRTNPKTGKDTHYGVGDTYDGDDIDKYLEWADGPLIAASDAPEVVAFIEQQASPPPADESSDGSAKK